MRASRPGSRPSTSISSSRTAPSPVDGTKLKLEDLLKIHVDLLKDGKVIKSGDSTEVLDQPIHALKWLVEALAKRGRKLTAGQVVSTGTFFVPPKLEKGEYIARYSGAITEDVNVNFQRFSTLEARRFVNAPKMSAHHRGIYHF